MTLSHLGGFSSSSIFPEEGVGLSNNSSEGAGNSSDEFDIAIGRAVKRMRLSLGFTQVEFGKVLGVSFQQLQKYENGANQLSMKRLHRLCTKVGITLMDFFTSLALEPKCGGVSSVAEKKPIFGLDAVGTNGLISAQNKDLEILVREFNGIKDPSVRKKIVALVTSIARSTAEEAEGGED